MANELNVEARNKLADAMARGMSPRQAGQICGYEPSYVASILSNKAFLQEIFDRRQVLVSRAGGKATYEDKFLNILRDVALNGDSDRARLSAAKSLLRFRAVRVALPDEATLSDEELAMNILEAVSVDGEKDLDRVTAVNLILEFAAVKRVLDGEVETTRPVIDLKIVPKGLQLWLDT